ncbi:MAG TPA: DinB family protein [Stellaceae bacterium]|jgi:uncharacterized damage-inducible protein DinB|nr:DinB family protein [Stellaceae bacterium]
MPSEYFATWAGYNAWANRRIYQACETLGEADYLRPRVGAFGSLHALLNHILAADRIWIARIEGRSTPGLRFDQVLYADLVALKVARLAEDERIRQVIAGLPEARLGEPLAWRDATGERCVAPLRLVLGHLFNQQTHHRGEAHALLSQAGVSPPILDLAAFLRESAAA